MMLSRSSRIFIEGHDASCCPRYVDGCVVVCIQQQLCLRGHRCLPAPQSGREPGLWMACVVPLRHARLKR